MRPDEIIPGWCTTAAVAAYLNLTPQRVRKLRNRLAGVDVGGAVVYPAAAVRAFARLDRPPGRPKRKGGDA